MEGYNASIFAYGQTGAGKTYTMTGPVSSLQSMHTDSRRGLLCRLISAVFGEIEKLQQETETNYVCRCSYPPTDCVLLQVLGLESNLVDSRVM